MRTESRYVVLAMLLGSCSGPDEPLATASFGDQAALEAAACQVRVLVNDVPSLVDLEPDPALPFDDDVSYVMRVVFCENGDAPLEALKAQAVMSRSLVFYRFYRYLDLYTDGIPEVGSGTGFQVYACTRTSTAEQNALVRQAVLDTRGEVMSWHGFVTWADFYAGSVVPEVEDQPGIDDDISHCAAAGGTVNWGLSGCNIHWYGGLPPDPPADCVKYAYVYNRGSAMQNGQTCLANRGWNHRDILRYYFGADIGFSQLKWACNGGARGPEDAFCVGKSGGYCFQGHRAYCRNDQAEGYAYCPDGCQSNPAGVDDECIGPWRPADYSDGGAYPSGDAASNSDAVNMSDAAHMSDAARRDGDNVDGGSGSDAARDDGADADSPAGAGCQCAATGTGNGFLGAFLLLLYWRRHARR